MGKSTEPPKCKICGSAHRGPCYTPMPRGAAPTIDQPKRRAGTKRVASVPPGTKLKTVGDQVVAAGPNLPASIINEGGLKRVAPFAGAEPQSSGFDKRAYQREYMRKRRAAARAAKASPPESQP